jgi:hypothetical protein
MSRVKVLVLALMAMCTFGVLVAASASAETITLPTIQVLPGETYPLILLGHVTNKGVEADLALESEPAKLVSKEVTTLLTQTAEGSTGTEALTFLGTTEAGHPTVFCNSSGDGTGVVLVAGEFHLVITNFTPLEIGGLTLFPAPLTINCEDGLEVKITPPALSKVFPLAGAPTLGGDITNINVVTRCSAFGIQEASEYYSNTGLLKEQLLHVKQGGKLGNGCEEVTETVLLGITPGQGLATMFTILY